MSAIAALNRHQLRQIISSVTKLECQMTDRYFGCKNKTYKTSVAYAAETSCSPQTLSIHP